MDWSYIYTDCLAHILPTIVNKLETPYDFSYCQKESKDEISPKQRQRQQQ